MKHRMWFYKGHLYKIVNRGAFKHPENGSWVDSVHYQQISTILKGQEGAIGYTDNKTFTREESDFFKKFTPLDVEQINPPAYSVADDWELKEFHLVENPLTEEEQDEKASKIMNRDSLDRYCTSTARLKKLYHHPVMKTAGEDLVNDRYRIRLYFQYLEGKNLNKLVVDNLVVDVTKPQIEKIINNYELDNPTDDLTHEILLKHKVLPSKYSKLRTGVAPL